MVNRFHRIPRPTGVPKRPIALAAGVMAAAIGGTGLAAGSQQVRVESQPISAELRLADVVVLAPGLDPAGVRIEFDGAPDGGVALRPGDNGAWVGRVRAAEPDAAAMRGGTFPATVRIEHADGTVHTINADIETAPPEHLAMPAWAMGRVWYQVFPERFRNGEPANDPRSMTVTTLPWTTPWWSVEPIEIEQAWMRRQIDPRLYGYRPSEAAGAFQGTVYARRYGGDLQGVVQQLDELVALGASGLYLCPIFQSRSLHKYDAADHRHVDVSFGATSAIDAEYAHDPHETEDPATWQWTDADIYFLGTVLPEARRRGMRVMLDGVWNHVGIDHWAFRDVLENGAESRYADWFEVEFGEDGRVTGWQGWARRNGDLPEFRQTPEGDLAPGPKQHIMDITRRWMDPDGDGDPSDGIDGWRLDVAAEIGRPFWRDWRALVKSINPEALIIAELWADGSEYYDGTAFDGQMNYPFAMAAADWLGLDPKAEMADMARRLMDAIGRTPRVDLIQMNLLTSHDTERLVSMLMNPDRGYDSNADTSAVFEGRYDRGPATAEAKQLAAIAMGLQALLPGAPLIYNGDEYALAGPDDPSDRQPIIWPDQAWQVDEARRPDLAFREIAAAWMNLRRAPGIGDVLRYGDVEIDPIPGSRALRVRRSLNGAVITGVLNPGDGPVDVAEALPEGDRLGPASSVVDGRSAGVWWKP